MIPLEDEDAHDVYALATFSSRKGLIDDSEEGIDQVRAPFPRERRFLDVIPDKDCFTYVARSNELDPTRHLSTLHASHLSPPRADNSIALGFDDPITTDTFSSKDHMSDESRKGKLKSQRTLSGISLGSRDMSSNNRSQSEASFEGNQSKMPGVRSALLDEYSHARERRKALDTTLPKSGTDIEDSSMEGEILDADESNTTESPPDNSP